MSVSTISYDGGGFGQWQFQRDLRASRFDPWQANANGGSLAGPPPASPPSASAASAVGSGGTQQTWLNATENAAGTLLGDLQAFLVDLQAGGSVGTAGGTGSVTTDAVASAGTDPAVGPAPAATVAPADTTGTTAADGAVAATGTTIATTDGTGGNVGNDAANLLSALQSFIGLLQSGPGEQASATTTSSGPPPWQDPWNHDGGGWHHHHDDGGWGEVSGELQTTNQLLGQILGAIQSYVAPGNQTTTQPATTSVSA